MKFPRIYAAACIAALAFAAFITVGSVTAADYPTDAGDIYINVCLKCHGPSGKGDGPACSVLQIKPGDFTDCDRMKYFSDEALFKVIKYGGPAAGLSDVMNGFAGGLNDKEISELVAYIRGFCAK